MFYPILYPFSVNQNTALVISFFKKAICLYIYTRYFMHNEGMRKGKMKEERNPYCRGQDVVEPNRSFLRMGPCALWELSFGVNSRTPLWWTLPVCCWNTLTASSNYFQLCRGISFVTWPPIKLGSELLTGKCCRVQETFISGLSGVCLLNSTTDLSCPATFKLMWLLFLVLTSSFLVFFAGPSEPWSSSAVTSWKRYQVRTETTYRQSGEWQKEIKLFIF